jgi:hypothetical protein
MDKNIIRETFLKAITDTFNSYFNYGPRSSKKLIPIHTWIAKTLITKLGDEYELVYYDGNVSEIQIDGKYYPKKVDIGIIYKKRPIAAISFKFVTSNYKQNSNNYFENLLGETANLRRNNIGFGHFLVLRAFTPYFLRESYEFQRNPKKIEKINNHDLEKYVKLFKDGNYPHIPDVLGICIIDFNERNQAYFPDYKNELKFSEEVIHYLENEFSVENFIEKIFHLCKLKS